MRISMGADFLPASHIREVGMQTHTGIPWIFTNAPNGVRSPAPLLGQHTDEVLRDVLGYRDEDIARLREQQVLY